MIFGLTRRKAIVVFLFYLFFFVALGFDFSDTLPRYLIDSYLHNENEIVLTNTSHESSTDFMPFGGEVRWEGFSVITSGPQVFSHNLSPRLLSEKQRHAIEQSGNAALVFTSFGQFDPIFIPSFLLQANPIEYERDLALNLVIAGDSFMYPLRKLECETRLPKNDEEIAISDLHASLLIGHGFNSNGTERHPDCFEDLIDERVGGFTIVGIYETEYSRSSFFNVKNRFDVLMDNTVFASLLMKNPGMGSILRFGDFQSTAFLLRPTKNFFVDYGFLQKIQYRHPYRGTGGTYTPLEIVLSSFWFVALLYAISLVLLLIFIILGHKKPKGENDGVPKEPFRLRYKRILLTNLTIGGIAFLSSTLVFAILDLCLQRLFVFHAIPSLLIPPVLIALASLIKSAKHQK